MNLQEDYCSYELSKLLKEKGFDVELQCDSYYEETQRQINIPWQKEIDGLYPHCTHALAMKWLREKWIFIEISFSVTINGEPCYNFGILSRSAQWVYRHKQFFSTYEGAVNAAIKYSLENLI